MACCEPHRFKRSFCLLTNYKNVEREEVVAVRAAPEGSFMSSLPLEMFTFQRSTAGCKTCSSSCIMSLSVSRPEGSADTLKSHSVSNTQVEISNAPPPLLLWANQRQIFHLVFELSVSLSARRRDSSAVCLSDQTPDEWATTEWMETQLNVPACSLCLEDNNTRKKWKSNIHIRLCTWADRQWRSMLTFH